MLEGCAGSPLKGRSRARVGGDGGSWGAALRVCGQRWRLQVSLALPVLCQPWASWRARAWMSHI